jgi:hypothetical protein
MTCRVIFILCALPLVIYPGVLMASLMALASLPNSNASPLVVAIASGFCWLSLTYPVGFTIGLAVSRRAAATGAAIAGGHLLLCVALLAAWYFLSGGER